MTQPSFVVEYWLSAGPAKWYAQDEDFDRDIEYNFGFLWQMIHDGYDPEWQTSPEGALAWIIMLDQFPRNMYRNDDPRAYSTDAKALDGAGTCLANEWDRKLKEPERQFVYMPFMHAESMELQNISVDLFHTRISDPSNQLHARAHHEVIKRFGRFPHRNKALGRDTMPEEQAYLDAGGYGSIVRDMQSAG